MSEHQPDAFEALTPAILALQATFDEAGVPYALIGGVAVALTANPRMTRDVDALVLLGQTPIDSLLSAASSHGIAPRIEDAQAFAARHNILLLVHEPSGVTIDVSLAVLPFEERAVADAREVEAAGTCVRILRPEDLIVMKAIAHRPLDLHDIDGIAAVSADLDRRRVLDELRPFAEALDSPDLVEEVRRLLDDARPPRLQK
jgi:predicted nucleotidyltransferase